ncbi:MULTISPECIES: pilus assembly protein [Pseudomonas]|uniref:Molecular chaperone n=1 Tax=Pseudomonas gessardii TaxID=78544 RepID=A0ABS9F6F9_9PSED|nr:MULTISPECIES: pilus assembly protein [Pseudomonas]MBH3420843.1 molecular chaperone [Pseudomonas gessardii]MCF4978883.1 molecular chaperone [Pseudomonas gessardii]MCF4990843.1 molecular chaperone [Pseudomonas gessardii]MCF5086087.1 molecular chaperone [Pseudomonas gessardii]MCF5094327.1 molecular chaperone [Pseudomonas gessardii]
MKHLLALCALCWLPLSAPAAPNINVGVFYDYLDGDKTTYLKRVFNGGDSTAFIKVSVMEILYNADGSSEEVELKSNPENTARDGLMATPARMIVPANGMQGTRLLYLGARDKERYFRLRFVPVMPEAEDEFVVSSEEREAYKNSLSAGVTVLAGFGTVFFVRPKDTRFATRVEERAGEYGLRNDGNSVVVVDQFKDCASGDAQDCLPVTKNHILPGRAFSFSKQAGRTYRFTLVEGREKQPYEVKG